MSKSIVAIAVLLAAILGISAAVMLSGPSTGGGSAETGAPDAGSATLFSIEPAEVAAITVERDGQLSSVRRGEGASWVFVDGPVQMTAPPTGWPANAPRIRATLDRLSRIDRVGEDVSAEPGESAVSITLTSRDGASNTLRVARVAIGGNIVAATDDRSGLIERSAVAPILDEGPSAWRLRNALPGVGPTTTSRLTIEAEGSPRLSFEKIETSWYLRSPVSARADNDAVDSVLSALNAAEVVRFTPRDTQADFADPAVTITSERDRRTLEIGRTDIRTERVVAEVASPFSGGGASVPARITLDDGSTHRVSITRDSLPQSATLDNAERLLAKSPSDAAADDVFFLTIAPPEGGETIGFRRRLGTWVEMRPDGGEAEVRRTTRESIDATVSLLTSPVGNPTTISRPAVFRTPARIELRDISGGVVDVLRVGYDEEGQPVVRAGGVAWRYSAAQASPVLELAQVPGPDQLHAAPRPAPTARAPPRPATPPSTPTCPSPTCPRPWACPASNAKPTSSDSTPTSSTFC